MFPSAVNVNLSNPITCLNRYFSLVRMSIGLDRFHCSNAAVRGWLGEWVGACVCPSVALCLVDMIQTTVFAKSLSNFTCKLWMMRGGTLLIMGHEVTILYQACVFLANHYRNVFNLKERYSGARLWPFGPCVLSPFELYHFCTFSCNFCTILCVIYLFFNEAMLLEFKFFF